MIYYYVFIFRELISSTLCRISRSLAFGSKTFTIKFYKNSSFVILFAFLEFWIFIFDFVQPLNVY